MLIDFLSCVGATNAFCDVFWDATGYPAKNYKVAQSLCAFQQDEHAGPVLGCTGIILNKGHIRSTGEVYSLQGLFGYLSLQRRVGGLLRRGLKKSPFRQ